MAMNKRKTTTAIVAGVTALALLLGGTFAWTSISQTAKNEAAGIVNVGGRLHDDFNGTNKDVYVENFTDPLNGGQPIYARVKLTEYMEVGQDAGGFGKDTDGDNKLEAVPVVSGTDINNKDSWPVHIPAEYCDTCNTGGTCQIHDHWTWLMGGMEGNDGSTVFMPTFNKDKDSLAADINGTYAGTNSNDKVYYDDYVVYTTDAANGGNDIAEADKEAYDGSIYSIIGTEYYDNDTDTSDNNGTRQEANVTHTAKKTATAKVITMAQWEDFYQKAPGNYWVYDTDGWAYWANPIMPGEATGLLLDGIEMTSNPGEKCYYAINVVAQFATVGDWEYFDGTEENGKFDGTDAAKDLLETVSRNVATVVVTNVSGATLLTPGNDYQFSANVIVNGAEMYAASDFTWSVLNADGTANTKSTITDGVLTVAENETSKNLIVVAKALDAKYLGALGMSSVAVNLPQIPDEITDPDVTLLGGDTIYLPLESGESKSYKLAFEGSDTPESFVVSKAYAKDGSSTELAEGTDYTYDPATQILTLTQRAEGVRIEFVSQGTDTPVYGLEVNVPVTPSQAGITDGPDSNNTYIGGMILNDAENVFYKVNLTDDYTPTGTPLELSDIQLSGDYNNGVTYDPETNLLFVPEPWNQTVLKAKYGDNDFYVWAVCETYLSSDSGYTHNYYLEGTNTFTQDDNGNYTATIEPGHIYTLQYILGDADDLVLEAAEGYPLGDGLAIATMLWASSETDPADAGKSMLNVSTDFTGEIHLKGYYYARSDTDPTEKHEVSIILTVE